MGGQGCEYPRLKGRKFWGSSLWSPSTYCGYVGHISEDAVRRVYSGIEETILGVQFLPRLQGSGNPCTKNLEMRRHYGRVESSSILISPANLCDTG